MDLAGDERPLADDQHVVAVDLALEPPVDAHPPLEEELALEVGAPPEQGVDLGGAVAVHRPGLGEELPSLNGSPGPDDSMPLA